MLVRAARRKVHHDALRNRFSNEHSHLPWSRPSHPVASGAQRWNSIDSGPIGAGLRQRRNSRDSSSQQPRRNLATVVGYRDEIPFEGGMGTMLPPYGSQSLSSLRNRETTTPLFLGGSLATAPVRYKASPAIGSSGTLDDLKSVFEACLQVGRIERAEVVFRRILELQVLTIEEALEMHNRYLRSSVEDLLARPSEAANQRLHAWFEMEMRSKGVHYDFETLAYMVKASLQSPLVQRKRLVRRYLDMLDEQSVLQLLVAEILTAQEINEIAHIYPKYKWAAQQTVENPEARDEAVETEETANFEPAVPLVRPTEQKGFGLKTLKKSLSLFTRLSDDKFDLSTATPEERRDIQARLEQDAVDSAVDRWKEESDHLSKMGVDSQLQTKSLGVRMWKWQVELERYLKEEIARVDKSEAAKVKTLKDRDRCEIGPFLRVLSPDKLAATVILSLMKVMGSVGVDKGVSLASAITTIAGTVEDESIFQLLQKNIRKGIWPTKGSPGEFVMTPELLLKATKSRGPGSASNLMHLYASQRNRRYDTQTPWSITTKAKLGAFLMTAIMEVAKVPVTLTHRVSKEFVTQMQPAFSHSHQYKMGKRLGIILANKVLVQQLKTDPVHSALAKHLPMLVNPEPWTRFDKGGFISYPGRVLRVKHGDQDQRFYAEAAVGQGDMQQTFKGLDILGKTAWKINQGVFDVMLEAWNTGEAIANMPPSDPNLEIPTEPSSTQDPLERRKWIRAVKGIENAKAGMHSQRCFQNFQLEIARALRNETFYFPHNVDFRGRAYPIPPYLNHMGADHCRGLLQFGEGKELGSAGLRWLKIHVANVFGYDKASLSEREQFTMDNIKNIADSASNPLGGARWWLTAEDPWQCLAACLELQSALKTGNPEKFISHLPVHQDGTCNGLQHYAALGGDSWGAKQVNLEPGDRPADVYSAVANLVIESINKDRKLGDARAVMLEGKVSRKTVKQTVMTNVYGVTFTGAKAQVRKQLAAHADLQRDDEMNSSNLASYVVTKIFTALSTMFSGAHDIQHWLGECSQRISTCLSTEQLGILEARWSSLSTDNTAAKKSQNHNAVDIDEILQYKSSVIWTNPLHMPIVQPYRKSNVKKIKTNIQTITLMDPHRSDPVDKRKQLQGFPPNFIHSLDATHMLLSALKCDELGLSFAAVHDSFWTHASDIETMNGVLRDAFIQIHSEDVIGRLRSEFEARYRDSMYCAKLVEGSLLAKKIKAWRSVHGKKLAHGPKSKTVPRIDELLLERQRMRLLNSSIPEEVEQGKKMVTPGSIFAESAADGDLAMEDDLLNIGLGAISKRTKKIASNEELEVSDEANIDEIHNSLPDGEQLDPLLGRTDSALESAESGEAEDVEEGSFFERKLGGTKRNSRYNRDNIIWLPLTFPPVPKKGDFDVSRLKDSQYFFS